MKVNLNMSEINEYIHIIMDENPLKIVLSKPRIKDNECSRLVLQKYGVYYQVEKLIGKQAFHENLKGDDVPAFIRNWMPEHFFQLNAFTAACEYSIMVSKNGAVKFLKNRAGNNPQPRESHNREKNYIFF
jgi:hypothetical protein